MALTQLARSARGILPNGVVHPDVVAGIASASGGGRGLGGEAARWTAALGSEVRGARLHTGSDADALARSVSARAFTVRKDVFFASGEYRPHTPTGRRLIAYELAHVVQQHGAPSSGSLRVTAPGDAHERAADSAADEILRGDG